MAPPAIPESSTCAGRARASDASAWPPFDFSSDHGRPSALRGERLVEGRRRSASSSGFRYASTIAVVPRSYSRQIGATSCESDTGTPGPRSRERIARRELVLGVEVREQVADGDGDVLRPPARPRAARLASASRSSGLDHPPSSSSRSATPRQSRRRTSGMGLRQLKS